MKKLIPWLFILLFSGCFSTNAPDVTLHHLDGNSSTLADNREQHTLLTFWATTCPGCIQEIPELVRLHQADNNLRVIGVAMSYDPVEQVQKLVTQKQLPYLIALDKNDAIANAFGGIRLTPTNVLIAPSGEILYQNTGIFDVARIESLIAKQ